MSILYNNSLFYPIKPILQVSARYLKFKKSKYGNLLFTSPEGILFDSISEYRRWRFLCQLEAAGRITNLDRQPEFELEKERTYTGDFMYVIDGKCIVEDVKSYKLMSAKKKFLEISDVLNTSYNAIFLLVPIKWILSTPEVVQLLPINLLLNPVKKPF